MRKRYSPTFKAEVVLEILTEEKSLAQIASERGVHPNQLSKWKAEALQGLPRLFEPDQETTRALQAAHQRQLEELYAEIGRLITQVNWLKKNLGATLPRYERLALVEREQPELSLTTQAELLSLSRASLYYQPMGPSAKEIAIKHRIDELYTAHPFYGSRRITALLGKDWTIGRERVQHYMREMGIAGIAPGPNLSKRNPEHRIYPYLLRNFSLEQPNQVWGVDITYIRLHTGWLYLVAILDWFSRYVISWELDQTLEMPFVLAAVERALAHATPQICNSDQGSHFTSPQYTQLLLSANVQISMDGRGRALDNIFTERLWRSLKYEEVYLYDYANPRAARHGLTDYLEFYNDERPHQALDYLTPAQVYYGKEAQRIRSTTYDRADAFTLNIGPTSAAHNGVPVHLFQP